jgi:battenin
MVQLQLIYQTGVFVSRSSISFGLPPLPRSLMHLPAIVQALMLVTLTSESAADLLGPVTSTNTITLVMFLISIEGICGGLA